jgi:protein involved in polysaccharide export with SLBB domain
LILLGCWHSAQAVDAGVAVAADNVLTSSSSTGDTAVAGSIPLRNTGSNTTPSTGQTQLSRRTLINPIPPYIPNEFERYVQDMAVRMDAQSHGSTTSPSRPDQPDKNGVMNAATGGNDPAGTWPKPARSVVRRFGANLMTNPVNELEADTDPLPQAPGDYIVKPGDEVILTIWGAADANLRLTVDRTGRISIPRVGAVQVAGVKQNDLDTVIAKQVGQTFRNFHVSASVGQLRTVRVFVTGFVLRPGSLNVSALSSVLHVLMKSGGPSAAGSFRDITLRRGGKVVGRFDLYDLLLHGDRATDQTIQPDDVIQVGPVGLQVGLLGSVNQPAIYELKAGETLGDLLAMGGGFNAVANRNRLFIEHLNDQTGTRVNEVNMTTADGDSTPLVAGDVVQVFSALASTLPKDRQFKRVHVDGEVARPGDYLLPPGSSMADALRAAGGLTPKAYLFGTEFTRESVRQVQQQNFDRALRDLETNLAKNSASRRVLSNEEASALTASENANSRLVNRLRQIRPTGRLVLPITPDANSLPEMALEDGDRITIPARGSSIGVFGSVFNGGSYIYSDNHTLDYYLTQAGGPAKGADVDSMFVVRANGTVVSARQLSSGWGNGASSFRETPALPGDTLFVPEEMNKTTGVQDAKDWTQILYQLGLGLAGIAALGL